MKTEEESAAMVLLLLSEMSPILPSTISEFRRACIVNSDHTLFSLIKDRFPRAFAPLSGSDEILLSSRKGAEGEDILKDIVEVEEAVEGEGGDMAFKVKFEVVRFQLRMKVSGIVRVEWIARGM